MATVRYVSSTSGVKVRSTPAGTVVATLYAGNLMYELPNINHENASLSGTNYEWAKVHYYLVGSTVSEGEGWVAIDFTEEISRDNYPGKNNTFNSDSILNQYQQLINAWYIYYYIKEYGWSDNAVFAMFGNMEAESTFNPGRCYYRNGALFAYGLTQWHEPAKLINWANERNLDYTDIDNQIRRIIYEKEYDETKNTNDPILQWDSSKFSPELDFGQFATSSLPVTTLSDYFLWCYERPGNEESEKAARRQNALKWSTILGYLT